MKYCTEGNITVSDFCQESPAGGQALYWVSQKKNFDCPTTVQHGEFCLLCFHPGPIHPSLQDLFLYFLNRHTSTYKVTGDRFIIRKLECY